MVYGATNFDGHQVFACEAENEEEAKKRHWYNDYVKGMEK